MLGVEQKSQVTQEMGHKTWREDFKKRERIIVQGSGGKQRQADF